MEVAGVQLRTDPLLLHKTSMRHRSFCERLLGIYTTKTLQSPSGLWTDEETRSLHRKLDQLWIRGLVQDGPAAVSGSVYVGDCLITVQGCQISSRNVEGILANLTGVRKIYMTLSRSYNQPITMSPETLTTNPLVRDLWHPTTVSVSALYKDSSLGEKENVKQAGKYDPELEAQARNWIQHMTGESVGVGQTAFHESLKDGQILCKLINALQPGSVKKINESKMAFKMMENIGKFLDACQSYGLNKTDTFQTVDLYENQNMPQVINGIHALGRAAQKHGKPGIGPVESDVHKREFTEEQLRSGDSVIGLQMGSNKGASQAGQNFGKTRQILD